MRKWTLKIIIILGMCSAGAAPSYSQEFLHYQVFGAIGAGAWTSRDYNAGRATGPIAGFGFEYRWSRRLGIKAEYSFWRASGPTRLTSPGPSSAVTTTADFAASGGVASVSLVWHWGLGRFQPYYFLGGGMEHSSYRVLTFSQPRAGEDAPPRLRRSVL